MERDERALRITRLDEQGQDNDLAGTTVEERFAIVWQLTIDAWAFMGEDIRESPFRRDIVRIVRRGS